MRKLAIKKTVGLFHRRNTSKKDHMDFYVKIGRNYCFICTVSNKEFNKPRTLTQIINKAKKLIEENKHVRN